MGTQFRLVLYTPDEPSANAASRAAFDRIAQLDAMLSDYRPDSELMQLCAKAGGPPVPVSAELFFVLSRSQDLSKRSDGAFDVTVGPLIRLWRHARRQHKLPDSARIAEARKLVGYENVRLNAEARTVELLKPRMQLDLGGIAKGYAADEAMAVLKKQSVTRALVAASGDIVVSDPPPGESGWTIGIAPPDEKGVRNLLPVRPDGCFAQKIPDTFFLLRNAAVSTSGDTEQFIEIEGRRYSHIVDPQTGIGLTDRLQVTVVAPTGTASDSLATAVCVLGVDRGLKLIESIEGTAALVARPSDEGRQIWESLRFADLPRGQSKQPK
jgi:thiamine biosynthesis lipoprotein